MNKYKGVIYHDILYRHFTKKHHLNYQFVENVERGMKHWDFVSGELVVKKYNLCGRLDAIFKHNNQQIIVDWKFTSRKIKFNKQKKVITTFSCYTGVNSYILQLNLYRTLYDPKALMYIGNVVGKSFYLIKCPVIEDNKLLQLIKKFRLSKRVVTNEFN